MCSVLLDAGAAGNTKDHKYGWTALMLATHQRLVEFNLNLNDITICGTAYWKQDEYSEEKC